MSEVVRKVSEKTGREYNDSNLVKITADDKEKMRKGGIKSGEVRRKRKSMREELDILLSMNNNQENILVAMINKAMDGDVKAADFIRDTVGEKPTDKMEADIKGEASINVIYEDPTK